MNQIIKTTAKVMKKMSDRQEHPAATRLGPETKTRMGQQLRVMYGEVMSEGMPDHYQELLQQLDDPVTLEK